MTKPDYIPPAPPDNLSTELYSGALTNLRATFLLTGDDGMINGRNVAYDLAVGIDSTLKDSANQGVQSTDFWTKNYSLGGGWASGNTLAQIAYNYADPSENRLLYFAVRVYDDAGNASPWSNVVKMQAGQAGTSSPVTSMEAEAFPYTVLDCNSCADNPGTALELDLNSWQVAFSTYTDLGGDLKLAYTVTDQKDLISYTPSAEGLASTDESYAFPREIVIDANSSPSGFPSTLSLDLPGSDTLPLKFSYADYLDMNNASH